jgi:hypothetical protein
MMQSATSVGVDLFDSSVREQVSDLPVQYHNEHNHNEDGHHGSGDHDEHADDHPHQHADTASEEQLSSSEVWVYSMLAVTGIFHRVFVHSLVTFNAQLAVNVLAFVGIALVPLLRRSKIIADGVLKALVSLSVGVLVGDAMLHLLPEAYGVHSHDDHEDHGDHEEHDHLKGVWMGSIVALGIYAFYAVEQVLRRLHAFKVKKRVADGGEIADPQVKPVAWLILLGDTLHNVIDGLLIGATFAVNKKTGFATTIAVFLVRFCACLYIPMYH